MADGGIGIARCVGVERHNSVRGIKGAGRICG